MTLWTFVEAHITNETRCPYEDSRYAQPIWPNLADIFACVPLASKRASCFISILENLASTKVHRAIVISEMLGTFFGVNTGWYCVQLFFSITAISR